jgi:hypothetical protein
MGWGSSFAKASEDRQRTLHCGAARDGRYYTAERRVVTTWNVARTQLSEIDIIAGREGLGVV